MLLQLEIVNHGSGLCTIKVTWPGGEECSTSYLQQPKRNQLGHEGINAGWLVELRERGGITTVLYWLVQVQRFSRPVAIANLIIARTASIFVPISLHRMALCLPRWFARHHPRYFPILED